MIKANYDMPLLMGKLKDKSFLVAKSLEADNLIKEITEKTLPTLKSEIIAKFKADLPNLNKKNLELTDKKSANLEVTVKNKIETLLKKSLVSVGEQISKEYPDMTDEKLAKIVTETQTLVLSDSVSVITKIFEKTFKDKDFVKNKIATLKQEKEYLDFEGKDISTIENIFIENVLEVVIYQMNSKKGAKLAFDKKGESNE